MLVSRTRGNCGMRPVVSILAEPPLCAALARTQRGRRAVARGRTASVQKPARSAGPHSLVMKLMNSDTHSCTVSLASFAILAFGGSAFFIIRLMFAIGRKRSCSRTLPPRSSPSSASAPLMGGVWMSQPNNPLCDPATQWQICRNLTRLQQLGVSRGACDPLESRRRQTVIHRSRASAKPTKDPRGLGSMQPTTCMASVARTAMLLTR